MKLLDCNSRSDGARLTVRMVLAWFLLALFPVAVLASGGGGGSGTGGSSSDPSANSSSPGEEVTSLPMVEDNSGVTFLGGLRELRAVVIGIQGQGRIDVRRMGRLFAVTLVGDFRVELDRTALARSSVQVLFRGGAAFQGGTAYLQIGTSSLSLPAERVALPLGRLASSPRAQGDLVTLAVFGLRGAQEHIGANFSTDRVVLTQRAF